MGITTRSRRRISDSLNILAWVTLLLVPAGPAAQGPLDRKNAADVYAVLDEAARAIGATRLESIEYSGAGSVFSIGQAAGPGKPWPRFRMTQYKTAIRYDVPLGIAAQGPVMREELTRVDDENPPRGGGAGPFIAATGQGGIRPIPFGPQTQVRQLTGRTDAGFVQIALMTPLGFLKAAAASRATATSASRDGRTIHTVSFARGNHTVTGEIDNRHLVERVESRLDNPVLGDMLVETTFSDYREFGGVMFPGRIVQRQGGHPTLDLTVADVRPNGAAALEIREAGPPAGPVRVEAEKIADGVWFLNGGAPISVLVEFADHLVIVEAPGNDARTEAAIAEAKRVVPNKPIRYLVNTHGHFDHSGGLRGFVAEGVTVITHQLNKPYFEQVLALPHTINPDRLARVRRAPIIEVVADKRVLSDATKRLELHHIRGNLHNEALLMAYLPKEKLLIQADAFAARPPDARPLPSPSPFTVNLWENVQRLKLDVEQIVHLHGGLEPLAALAKAAGKL
jgi:glyoxylase-like metal-dependent hydrolase (beta-lactamase superfamily II)